MKVGPRRLTIRGPDGRQGEVKTQPLLQAMGWMLGGRGDI